MMTRKQAEAYGRKTGCKFYVKNDRGGLYGGFATREAAEKCKAKAEKDLKNNPWMQGEDVVIYIEVK